MHLYTIKCVAVAKLKVKQEIKKEAEGMTQFYWHMKDIGNK